MVRKKKRRSRKKVFNRKYGFLEIFIEIIILFFLINPMFRLGLFTGIAYLIALFGSVITGLFFRKRKMARLIVLGTLIGYFAGYLFSIALIEYDSNNLISFIIILGIALIIWYKGFKMRKGKR